MVEQVAAAFELADRMVRRPADHRGHDLAAVGEGAIRAIPDRIAEQVGIARRVGEIVLAVVPVQPGRLEITALVVASEQGLAVLVEDEDRARAFCELRHVGREPRHPRRERFLVCFRLFVCRVIRIVAVLLQLPAPDSAEIHVEGAVDVLEHRRIDRIAAFDRLRLGHEGTGRVLADGDADLEDAVRALGREVQVVLAVLAGGIRRPHLALGPGHVLHVEGDAVVHGLRAGMLEREDVVVLHREMVAVVVEGDAGLDVVRGIDVDPAVEDVGGRVGGIDVRDERSGDGARLQLLYAFGVDDFGHG